MKSSVKSLFLSSLVLPLCLAGCDSASTAAATKFRSKIAAYDVDLAAAIEVASAVVQAGVVVDAEYDDDRWEVVLVSEGTRSLVAVHPMTGETTLLSERAATSEEVATAEFVANAPTSLSEALVSAQGAAPGALPYEISAGLAVFEVDLVDESTFLDAKVNPLDGECDDVEEDDDEDPEEDEDEDEDDDDDDDHEEEDEEEDDDDHVDEEDDEEEDDDDDHVDEEEDEEEEDDDDHVDEEEDEEDDDDVEEDEGDVEEDGEEEDEPGCEAEEDGPAEDDDAQCIPGSPCTDGDGDGE